VFSIVLAILDGSGIANGSRILRSWKKNRSIVTFLAFAAPDNSKEKKNTESVLPREWLLS
jgi:hypothetical protein